MGRTNKHNAEGYVITVGRVGASCGRFVAYRGKAWVNNNASHVVPLLGYPSEWFFLALCRLDLSQIRKGAAQPFVSNGDIAKLPVVFPGHGVLATFQALVSPLMLRAEHSERESETLAATRDLLLPKLMSGEIRLGEAEGLVEAAQ